MQKSYIIIVLIVLLLTLVGTINTIFKVISKEELSLRPQYKEIDDSVFDALPSYPDKFIELKRNFYAGQINDLTEIDKSYWLQPEFYPTWETNGISWFTNHNYDRWGVHGYGFFPGKISYNILNMIDSDTLSVYSYLHTSWGIESWQGIKLIPIYNQTLFNVQITPDTLLLEPTFPKFYSNWSYLVNYSIIAKQKIPTGQYTFSVRIGVPTESNNEQWAWDVLDIDTKRQYTSEIENCKKQLTSCDTLLKLRNNKYISGGNYAPDTLFTIVIDVS